MTLHGHIEDGHLVIEGQITLPEGTKVIVSVEPVRDGMRSDTEFPSLFERLKGVAGKAKGLPADLAINHDHYLHGQPKRQ